MRRHRLQGACTRLTGPGLENTRRLQRACDRHTSTSTPMRCPNAWTVSSSYECRRVASIAAMSSEME